MKFIDIRKRIKQAICSAPQELIMLVYTTPQEGIYAYEEVQPVVRCKDCKYICESGRDGSILCWRLALTHKVELDGFCSWGERNCELLDKITKGVNNGEESENSEKGL